MICKVCKQDSSFIFSAQVLNKYTVDYYRCKACGFIQTEEPYWLAEAYASAITSLDIGLLSRNITLLPTTTAVIHNFFNASAKFIDYGGGYGMFTRLMRDHGFDFYRQDIYCENLFAKNFDITDVEQREKFELLTAFEVFEHLADPAGELDRMLQYSDSIFFSTELVPAGIKTKDDWWYFMPETGQHIALHTTDSLTHLAKQRGLYFYSNGKNLHLITPRRISTATFKLLMNYRVAKLMGMIKGKGKTLMDKDYQLVLQKMHQR